jgi:Xaa-Pro aminopeptidase
MVNRRSVLKAAALATIATPLAGLSDSENQPATAPTPPDLEFLKSSPLADADRARYFMAKEGLDAIVVTHPANVFYLSNHWPQLDRMGFTDTAAVVFPRDPSMPLALIMHAFNYYYSHSPEDGFTDRIIYPYTAPADEEVAAQARVQGGPPPAMPARGFEIIHPDLVTELELSRAAALAKARPTSASSAWALSKALKEMGLNGAVLGYDARILEPMLRTVGVDAELRPCENTLRRIRLAKSPAEIRLMRIAAQANVVAGMAAAKTARESASTRQLRARFFSEAALRGNDGVFMVVNSSSSEVIDQPLEEGMAFAIDCVSTCRFYHGDFGRTVFVGEPHKNMQRSCNAVAIAWRDIQQQLKPGLRFEDVSRIGKESLKKQGVNLNVLFRPHSVGLFHTDHPQPSLMEPRTEEALVLEENMILSVDCPVLEAGIGGTAHLEDLMLITKNGAEAIHEVPDSIIIV